MEYSNFSHTVEVRPPPREAMRIIYDWRLARVIDEDSNILDEAAWTASRTSSKVANRLGDLQRGRMTQETRVLSERFPDARLDPFGHLDISDWPEITVEEEQMVASADGPGINAHTLAVGIDRSLAIVEIAAIAVVPAPLPRIV